MNDNITQTNLDDVANSITGDDVMALAFVTLSPLTDDQKNTFIHAAQIRLMAGLCLTSVPTTNVAAWKMLLANYVAAVYQANKSGIVPTTEKQVRNFRVMFGNQGSIDLKSFYSDFSDQIGMFQQCKTNIMFDGGNWQSDDFPDGIRPGDMNPDFPSGRWF